MRWQPRIIHVGNGSMPFKVIGNFSSIMAMPFHTNFKRAHTIDKQECIERIAVATQQLNGLFGPGGHEFKITANQHPTYRCTMTVQEFSSGMYDKINPIQ